MRSRWACSLCVWEKSLDAVPTTRWIVNSSPSTSFANAAFHKRLTAPRGPKTTIGNAPIWNRVPGVSGNRTRVSAMPRNKGGDSGNKRWRPRHTENIREDKDGKPSEPQRPLPVALAFRQGQLFVCDVTEALDRQPCSRGTSGERDEPPCEPNSIIFVLATEGYSAVPKDWTRDATRPTVTCTDDNDERGGGSTLEHSLD